MNKSQLSTVQRITRNITNGAKRLDGERWSNGPVFFNAEDVSGNAVMLTASNAGDEKKLSDTHCFALVIIGTRSGIRIVHCEGFSRTF